MGSSLAEANWGGGQQNNQGTVYNDGDIGRSELRYGAAAPAQQPEVDAVLGAFNNSTPVGIEDGDVVAAAGDYNLGRARRTAMGAGPIHDEPGNGGFSGTGLKVDPSKLPRFWTSERFESRYAPSLGWKELGEYLNPVTRLEGFADGFSLSGVVDGAIKLFTDPEGSARAMQDSTRKYFEAGRRGDFETAARFEGQLVGEQAAGLVLGYGVGRGLGFGARGFNAMGGVASDLVSSTLAPYTGLRAGGIGLSYDIGSFGGIGQILDVRRISASQANAPFLSPRALSEGWSPPYPEPSGVRTFTTARELGFVRLHTSADNPAGGFVVRAKEIAHLGDDASAIRTYLGLKDAPAYISDVSVPAGIRMQTGIIGPQPNFGLKVKSGFQYQLLDRLPSTSFTNTRPLRWTPTN